MFAHIPKINAGLGCVVLLCFFLPWVSFSCGTVTFLKLSGYHLTAGKVPADESVLKKYEERSGSLSEDERVPEDLRSARPKFIYLIVIICALNIIGFSLRMLEGGPDRFKSMAVMIFADIGLVFMVVAGVLDFGIGVPPEAGSFIESSLEFGYFGTAVSFFAAGALSLFALWMIGQATVRTAPVELQIAEEAFSGPDAVKETDAFTEVEAEHFGITPKKKPEVQAPASPGVNTCPACNASVGEYQVKCVKCGSALKPKK